MSKRVGKVRVNLDSKDLIETSMKDIKTIIRGADDLIISGGRNLLAKILKGSKEKKLLELKLNESPVYGCFKTLKIDDILARVDWCIENDYLAIEYNYRLPLLIYNKKGWEKIECRKVQHKINGIIKKLNENIQKEQINR